MKDKVKKAFDCVRADEQLKANTKAFLAQKMNAYAGSKHVEPAQRSESAAGSESTAGRESAAGSESTAGGESAAGSKPASRKIPALHRRLPVFAGAAACMLCLLICGGWIFLTPTTQISIDINPSMELGVNRFDRVVSARGCNADGERLVQALDIWFADYTEAVHQITENADVAALLSEDAVLEITVVGKNDRQCERVLSGVESCTHGQQNVYCHSAHEEELHGAHEHGLSYGKYRAYLELKELGADITPEEVQGMTMREIRELMDSLSGEQTDATEFPPDADDAAEEIEETEETDSSCGDGQDGSGQKGHHGHH